MRLQIYQKYFQNMKNYVHFDISDLFTNCELINLQDISKWKTSNINNMSGVFRGCFYYNSFLIYQNGIHLM